MSLNSVFNFDVNILPPKISNLKILIGLLGLPIQKNKLHFSKYKSVILLIFICIILYIFSLFSGQNFTRNWSLHTEKLNSLLTFSPIISSVLHGGGFFHLCGNCYFIYLYGSLIEKKIGSMQFILFFIFCCYFTALIDILYYWNEIRYITGLSGFVSAVMAFYLVNFWQKQVSIFICFIWITFPVFFIIPYKLLLDYIYIESGGSISFISHFAGTVIGFIYGFYFKLKYKQKLIKPTTPRENTSEIDWSQS